MLLFWNISVEDLFYHSMTLKHKYSESFRYSSNKPKNNYMTFLFCFRSNDSALLSVNSKVFCYDEDPSMRKITGFYGIMRKKIT